MPGILSCALALAPSARADDGQREVPLAGAISQQPGADSASARAAPSVRALHEQPAADSASTAPLPERPARDSESIETAPPAPALPERPAADGASTDSAPPAPPQEPSADSTPADAAPPAAPARAPRPRPQRPFDRLGSVRIGGVTYHPYRFEGHVHTAHSRDAKHGTLEILSAAERLGLDALVITDHGVSAARFEFSRYQGKLTPFVGREIGGEFGHAVMWNVAEDERQTFPPLTLEQRSRFAHEHGGLLIFAHPGWWIDGNHRDPMQWMTPEAMRRGGSAGDVDAIELWNGVYHTPLPKLIAAWVALLEAGVFVPIVGNSDFHRFHFHRLGSVHNIALCDRPEVASCLWPAVRAGRVMVTDGPAAVLSVNDRLPGAVVQSSGAPLRVAVEALAPEGGTLRVYLGKQVVHTLALARGQRTSQSWDVPSPAQDSYVRIDIERPGAPRGLPPVSLLSNPVLIDVGPRRAGWR